MSKLELSINVKYLPEWGYWEGIRELVQNGKDAETEFNAPLKVTFYNNTLRIENEGAELTREALLFGTSSKVGRSDMIGKFGEGLKLGVLALVRGGRSVKIRTGGEVWTAYIARSERYDADVLHFDCKGGNEEKRRVRVEIDNVSTSDWDTVKDRFLFLSKVKQDDRIDTNRGTLLLGDKYKGRVFVKGIYVQTSERLSYGYDFRDAEIDRDRKMISSWNLQWETGQICAEAAAKRPDLLDPFFNMMLDGKSDVAGLENSPYHANKDLQKKVAEKFTAKFGKDALPVATLAESAEIEHLGKKGVIVSKSLGAVLAETLGDKQELQKQLREEVVKTLSWSDLDESQRTSLWEALYLIAVARPDRDVTAAIARGEKVVAPDKLSAQKLMELVDVVEFRSPTLMGQFKDGRLLVASRLLADRDLTLETLVHEFSHREGGDGEKGHVAAIEALWRDIVKFLRNGGKAS